MKKMTKFLMALALISLSAGMANAQTTSGKCGDSLTWSLTGTKPDLTLTISGTGDMYNYRNNMPWRSQRKYIKTLVLHDGMTSIGSYAFGAMRMTSVTIPFSVKTIGVGAFMACLNLTSVTIPNSLMAIGKEAFYLSGTKDVYVSWTPSPSETLMRILWSSSAWPSSVNLHIMTGPEEDVTDTESVESDLQR